MKNIKITRGRKWSVTFLLIFCFFMLTAQEGGCVETVEEGITDDVDRQVAHFASVQPLHFYDYSIPRDVLQQIYDILITQAVATYSVSETVTGELKWACHSIGYAIPVDTQLTNPVRTANDYSTSSVIEQPEPSGLYSSKNTDGTWVLCVEENGTVYPYYSEHKIQVWPFPVVRRADGSYKKLAGASTNVTIDTSKLTQEIKIKAGNDVIKTVNEGGAGPEILIPDQFIEQPVITDTTTLGR